MEWNEYHHAWIVSRFYQLLTGQWGERGKAAFILAAQTYGEQRGKRMAMRAIADGCPLDYVSYFAYGEYGSTDEFFDVEMWGEAGVVNERVTRCPWADLFAKQGLKDCGALYCREIDRAIVRGFNPELLLETASTQHYGDCCRFYFRDAGVTPEVFEQADARKNASAQNMQMPMSYHCAHVFHVFSVVAQGIFGAAGVQITEQVRDEFSAEYGSKASGLLARGEQISFETIVDSEEWQNGDEHRECV